MNWEMALALLRSGYKISRQSWSGSYYSQNVFGYVFIVNSEKTTQLSSVEWGHICDIHSQRGAEDWYIVEDDTEVEEPMITSGQ